MASSTTVAHNFLDTHVVPNHEEWLVQPTDLRLAMNAVLSLYHMADHFWHAYGQTDPDRTFHTARAGEFRAEMARRDSRFAVLRDVAEAHKHMRLDRPVRTVTESSQTAVGSTGYGEAGYGTGPFGGGPSIVVVLDDGSKQHLSNLAYEVRQLWISMLT
ncbi:hypothetical protein [Halomonas elongata]|uniref:hypothetical protein n=1 Tax=Halomonas elongata TaxID=2746 RepID=UPI0023B0F7CE|nr:hypothetical protein [Halomonas elongata]